MRKAEGLDTKSSMDAQHGYHARCDAAMEKLADKWEEVSPTSPSSSATTRTRSTRPSSSIRRSWCSSATTSRTIRRPRKTRKENLPPGIAEAEHGHATDTYTEYHGVPDLGPHIIKTLVENEFDVAASKVWPKHARNGASHAFGHIYRQVMRDKVVPNVPVYQLMSTIMNSLYLRWRACLAACASSLVVSNSSTVRR